MILIAEIILASNKMEPNYGSLLNINLRNIFYCGIFKTMLQINRFNYGILNNLRNNIACENIYRVSGILRLIIYLVRKY